MDLPMITEATSEFYRNVYADSFLGPIFKGVNMLVLRNHVSYFIHQLTMFDTPMTPKQIEYLRKVHTPTIMEHKVTQHHFNVFVTYLTDAMRTNGAQDDHLVLVRAKLKPLEDMFLPNDYQEADAAALVQNQQQEPAADVRKLKSQSTGRRRSKDTSAAGSVTAANGAGHASGRQPTSAAGSSSDGKPHSTKQYRQQKERQADQAHKVKASWVRRLTSCMCTAPAGS